MDTSACLPLDLAEAGRLLDLLAEGEAVTFQTFDDGGKSAKLARVLHGDLAAHGPALVSLNGAGAGVFWMVNAGDGKARKAGNVERVRCLFVDLDGAPLEPVSTCALSPHAVVESSPGRFHAYWLVSDCPLERFGPLQSALAARFGGDPVVKDLPRVMRLPGFIHQKDKAAPFRSRVLQLEAMQPYAVSRLVESLELAPFLDAGADPRGAASAKGKKSASSAPVSPVRRAAPGEVERVRGALRYCGSADGYAEWVEVGMALHDGFGGSEQGFGLWCEWAGQSAKFDIQASRAKWESFGRGGAGGVTLGSLVFKARSNGWREAVPPAVSGAAPGDDGPPAWLDECSALPPELPPAFADARPIVQPWPDPMMPGAAKVEDIPADILPGWVGAMAEAVAASTQTPPAASVMMALSVLASVLQRRFEVAPWDDDYREPLALWTLTALPSGSRKTAVIEALAAPLLRWEKRAGDRARPEIARAASARMVAESRIAKLKAEASKAKDASTREAIRAEIQKETEEMPEDVFAPRLFTGDTTAERLQGLLVEQGERFAVLSDEAGIFQIMAGMYSGGVGALDVFLQAHAGSAVRVDRAGRLAHLDRPALSFGLALQPGILANVAKTRQFRDSGLLARFLFAIPESTVGRRNVRQRLGVPEDVKLAYGGGLDRLLEGMTNKPGKPRVLPLTGPAREAWLDFCDELESQQGEGGRFHSVCDWTSKLPGAVARIACLMELADVGLHAESVSQDATERALRLARILISHALAAFDLLGADPVEEDAAALLTWARGNRLSEFSQRECMMALSGRFRQKEPLEKVAKMLQERDVIRIEKRANKGARASVVYLLNPGCLS